MKQTQSLNFENLTLPELQDLNNIVQCLKVATYLATDSQLKTLVKSRLLDSFLSFHELQILLDAAEEEIENTYMSKIRMNQKQNRIIS